MGDGRGANVQRAREDACRYLFLYLAASSHHMAVVTDLIKCVQRMQSDKTRRHPNEILIAHSDVYSFFCLILSKLT